MYYVYTFQVAISMTFMNFCVIEAVIVPINTGTNGYQSYYKEILMSRETRDMQRH